jgi:glycosyltransferase involved in cell wall biosynthesis
MTAHLRDNDGPVVVHVIPSPRGRGAQRAARVLVNRLDESEGVRHLLLGLFDGPPEVETDMSLDHPGGDHPAEGFDARLALRLRRVLSELNPVAVVAHGGDAMKYVRPAVMFTRRPLVYCVIGTYAGPVSPFRVWAWRRIMARADLVVAVGDAVLDECIQWFRVLPRKVMEIPNGRDPSEYRPRSVPTSAADATLIFVGALTPQKQPDRFVDVVHSLRSEGRTLHAQIVGDGPLAGTLGPTAEEQGIEFLGPRSDVPELLRRSDVLVFTGRPTGEGMPGVLIEAGLSGIPAVSTRVPGAATILCDGTTGLIVDDSVAAIAAAVARLLDDPTLRAAMGTSARSWCSSEFSLDLMAERWRTALRPMVVAQAWTARRGTPRPARRASALFRAMRSRRDNSQT